MENPARVALLKHFKWKRVAVIVQQADIFELVIKKGSLIFISLACFSFLFDWNSELCHFVKLSIIAKYICL